MLYKDNKKYIKSPNPKPYYGLRVRISQKNIRLLTRILKFLKANNIRGTIQGYKTKRDCYEVCLSTRQAERFIQKTYPYIVTKVEKDKVHKYFKIINKSKALMKKYSYYEKKEK